MYSAITAVIIVSFCGYLFFDAMTIMSRSAASTAGRNAFGASIEKMMHTLKRLLMFMYPPALGYLVMIGDRRAILGAIAYSFLFGSLLLIAVIATRRFFLRYFYRVTLLFQERIGLSQCFVRSLKEHSRIAPPEDEWAVTQGMALLLLKRWRLLFLASFVYFLYGSSIFFVNLLALHHIEFAPVLLQSLGIINGLGTVLLAFVVDPAISRYLDDAKGLGDLQYVLLCSQLCASAFIGPVFFLLAVMLGL